MMRTPCKKCRLDRMPDAMNVVLLVALWAAGGCSILLPEPDRVPATAAALQERESCDPRGELDARLYGPSIVHKVGPLISITRSSNNEDFHLQGALLQVNALPGVTKEWLERTLRCYEARVVLGKLRDPGESPYWLPGGWVTIGVESESGAFAVSLRGDDPPQARSILSRATNFARPSSGPP
jgi:hypothetical protein